MSINASFFIVILYRSFNKEHVGDRESFFFSSIAVFKQKRATLPAMKTLGLIALWRPPVRAGAQDAFTLDDLARSAEQWAKENLDEMRCASCRTWIGQGQAALH